jgi:hypothetical protein
MFVQYDSNEIRPTNFIATGQTQLPPTPTGRFNYISLFILCQEIPFPYNVNIQLCDEARPASKWRLLAILFNAILSKCSLPLSPSLAHFLYRSTYVNRGSFPSHMIKAPGLLRFYLTTVALLLWFSKIQIRSICVIVWEIIIVKGDRKECHSTNLSGMQYSHIFVWIFSGFGKFGPYFSTVFETSRANAGSLSFPFHDIDMPYI